MNVSVPVSSGSGTAVISNAATMGDSKRLGKDEHGTNDGPR